MKTGSALDTKSNKGLPEPGSYQVAGGIGLKYNGGMSGFGSAKRLQEQSTKSFSGVPGPGQYTIDHDNALHGPKIGFGTSTRN